MTAVAEQVESASMSAEGFIGRIPVRNLWLLMLYASDLFRTRGIGKIGLEDSPDDLPDLVAEILAHAVEVRQRRRLSLGYRSRDAVINRVRGRIDGRLQFFARIIACVHMAAQARETGVADKFKAAHGHGGGLIMAV